MLKQTISRWLGAAVLTGCTFVVAMPAMAQNEELTPNALVEKVTNEVLQEIKQNSSVRSGNVDAARDAVDRLVMPHINFPRMTAAAVGPAWRTATPAQRTQVVNEFKTMLIRTYAGSLDQIGNMSVVVLPMRAQSDENDVLVRSEVRGGDQPIKLDYRLQRTPGEGYGWKVYNVNVMGAWIVDSYRSQFQPIVNSKGIEGLIESLKKGDAK